MNTRLLRRVEKHITEEPKRLYMGDWGRKTSPDYGGPPCGTVCCIAGWAAVLSNPSQAEEDFHNLIWDSGEPETNNLGLDDDQSDRLFFVSSWPEPFKKRYMKAVRNSTQAKIAVERIEHFIKTKGEE